MVLNHIAAVLLFSGPLMYLGLWMVVDPAGIVGLAELPVQLFRSVVRSLSMTATAGISDAEHAAISRRLRTAVRVAGVALLLFAVVA
jgi:hypothetical protein